MVDLDKFTLQTMTEVRSASQMKSASGAISAEQTEFQKLLKAHTNYEKKAFKVLNLEPKKQTQTQSSKTTTAEFAKFNYRGADDMDINGLVDRDEGLENELRSIVLNYLQKLCCQMALAKRVVDDFNRVYAPSSVQ